MPIKRFSLLLIVYQVLYAVPITIFLERSEHKHYVGRIRLGNPGKEFVVLIDLTSFLLWVPSILSGATVWPGFSKYDQRESTSGFFTQRHFTITYPSGNVSGQVMLDHLRLSERAIPCIRFGAAITVTTTNALVHMYEGILGLAPKAGELPLDQTLLDQMKDYETITERLFTLYFCRFVGRMYKLGRLTFGDVVREHYIGELQYTPVFVEGIWSFAINGIKVSGNPILLFPVAVSIDSKKPYILGPYDTIASMHQHIPYIAFENGIYRLNCSRREHLPPIEILVGSQTLILSAEDYVTQGMRNGEPYCYSTLRRNPSSLRWILGSPFLQGFFTVFDQERNRLGFARPNC